MFVGLEILKDVLDGVVLLTFSPPVSTNQSTLQSLPLPDSSLNEELSEDNSDDDQEDGGDDDEYNESDD